MTRRLVRATAPLLALPFLAACIPPDGVSAEDLARFDDAVASIGCTLRTERQYLPVELQTGLPRPVLQQVAGFKVSMGEAVSLEEGGIRLTTGACVPTESTETEDAAA